MKAIKIFEDYGREYIIPLDSFVGEIEHWKIGETFRVFIIDLDEEAYHELLNPTN